MGGKSTTSTKADPQITAAALSNFDTAKGLLGSYKPYTGQLSADPTSALKDYWGNAQELGAAGKGLLGSAAGAAQGALGYQPQMVTAPSMTPASAGRASLYDPSAAMGMLGNTASASGVNAGDIGRVGLADLDRSAIQQFFNPFEDTAVQSAIGDYEIARQRQGLNDAAAASAAHAFGGSRHGVADALTNEAFQRTSQGAVNDLRLQGYNTALSGALQQRGQNLQGQMANQQADVARAGINADTSRFNAGQQNDFTKTAAGLLGQAGIFNADATNSRAESEAGRQQQAGLADQAATLEALLRNQDAGLRGAGLQLQAGGLLGDLGQAGIKLGGDAATQQQALQQDALTREYQAFIQDLQNKLGLQGVANGALGALPQNTTTTQNKGFGLTDIANIGLSAASLFSDARLKEDIQTAGYDARGRRWVDYRYVWDEPGVTHRGVLAQEVQETDPHAVGMHPSGFLMVDYSKLEG